MLEGMFMFASAAPTPALGLMLAEDTLMVSPQDNLCWWWYHVEPWGGGWVGLVLTQALRIGPHFVDAGGRIGVNFDDVTGVGSYQVQNAVVS